MKSLVFALIASTGLSASGKEVTVFADQAVRIYSKFIGIEQIQQGNENVIVKVGDGAVCWQYMIPGTTDVAMTADGVSVKCTYDDEKITD